MATVEDTSFKRDMLKTVPSLRAFAVSLCGHQDLADDLVRDECAVTVMVFHRVKGHPVTFVTGERVVLKQSTTGICRIPVDGDVT